MRVARWAAAADDDQVLVVVETSRHNRLHHPATLDCNAAQPGSSDFY
jgi:hypothetical protein